MGGLAQRLNPSENLDDERPQEEREGVPPFRLTAAELRNEADDDGQHPDREDRPLDCTRNHDDEKGASDKARDEPHIPRNGYAEKEVYYLLVKGGKEALDCLPNLFEKLFHAIWF